MEINEDANGGAYAYIDDDKSDTIMTGFNTDDPIDDYDKLIDTQTDQNIDNYSSKSVGNEVKMPFRAEVRDIQNPLHKIAETDESNSDFEPESPEK
jgi:hypothetical protein